MSDANMEAKIITHELSDGSLTFDVLVSSLDGGGFMVSAVSYKDAEDFMFGLRDLLEKHTVEIIEIR